MPVQISGRAYFLASEVARTLGVTRQTLWRWRTDGRIPAGHRYRERHLVFTDDEVAAIRRFAERVEPAVSVPTTVVEES